MKKFYRSSINKRIAGVCGGLGEYTDTDPFWYRILFIFGGLYNLDDTDKFRNIIPEKINKVDLHMLISKSKEYTKDHDMCKEIYRRIIEYIIDFSIKHEEMKNEANY